MRQFLLLAFLASLTYGCIQLSGKEPHPVKQQETAQVQKDPPEELRVGKAEAMTMRGRRKGDDAAVKIAASDLLSLMNGSTSPSDSFIFYFVKYDVTSDKERGRYSRKGRDGDWREVGKKPSSLLVGFISGAGQAGMRLSPQRARQTIPVYDLGLLCPPPPDCNCEIAQ